MKSVKNLKNINTILNAPYPYVLKLKPPAPFSRKFITTYMELSSMPFWRKYKDPPTFMKCGINFLKMLIIVITYNICSFFIYLHYFFKGIYLRNILSYYKYTFGLINFWFDAVRSTFRGDPIFSLQKHSSHLARLYFGLFFFVVKIAISHDFL